MPNLWQGIMMVLLFSIVLGWFPTSWYGTFAYLIMPALTIGTSSAATITRMTRSSILEVVRQDYIRTARAKGLSERDVIMRHALKNDYPVVQGGVLLLALAFSVVNLVVDVLYAYIDPRIKAQYK